MTQENLEDDIDRKRLARILEKGLATPAGFLLPLIFDRNRDQPSWVSGPWRTRTERVNLIPGDSPMGFRLPLNSLVTMSDEQQAYYQPLSPLAHRGNLASPADFRLQNQRVLQVDDSSSLSPTSQMINSKTQAGRVAVMDRPRSVAGASHEDPLPELERSDKPERSVDLTLDPNTQAIPFALCVEVRNGTLHVFMPPTDRLEQYLEVLAAVEDTAAELDRPVVIEGYKPPTDHRIHSFSITPDPGVIEVNVQPAKSWDELKQITEGLYDDARHCRLGTEKFDVDGTHTGTGGGNHIVLGGPTPLDSPLLRRPDLLRSLVGFWQNHPSLSYLFSSRFIGPTSQAPRVDEGRADSLYELQIAFDELDRQMKRPEGCPPWLADRLFRNLLIDVTGNTHRAEFCIDKLYSPDSSSGRLGLLEFRGFEMPPHQQMSLTQQLLIRTLVAQFWKQPYKQPLVDLENQTSRPVHAAQFRMARLL